MRMFVAVDFTASNGPPRDARSLHFMRPGHFNEYASPALLFEASVAAQSHIHIFRYQCAIASIGEILQSYDSSKLFAAYGFGGLVRNVTSHCFALNGAPAAPCVTGVQGILDAYEKALLNVGLSGPTNFAPVISTVAQAVASFHQVPRHAIPNHQFRLQTAHTAVGIACKAHAGIRLWIAALRRASDSH